MRVREPCLLAASAFSARTVTAAADRQATVDMQDASAHVPVAPSTIAEYCASAAAAIIISRCLRKSSRRLTVSGTPARLFNMLRAFSATILSCTSEWVIAKRAPIWLRAI